MPNKIYCIEYFDGCDWDTDHARLSDARASQFPLRNTDGELTARLLHAWTDEEYKEKFAREFQDFGESVGWSSREEQESKLILDSYEGGNCPDCGEAIPTDVKDGQECDNCGHVFCPPQPDDSGDYLNDHPGPDCNCEHCASVSAQIRTLIR